MWWGISIGLFISNCFVYMEKLPLKLVQKGDTLIKENIKTTEKLEVIEVYGEVVFYRKNYAP